MRVIHKNQNRQVYRNLCKLILQPSSTFDWNSIRINTEPVKWATGIHFVYMVAEEAVSTVKGSEIVYVDVTKSSRRIQRLALEQYQTLSHQKISHISAANRGTFFSRRKSSFFGLFCCLWRTEIHSEEWCLLLWCSEVAGWTIAKTLNVTSNRKVYSCLLKTSGTMVTTPDRMATVPKFAPGVGRRTNLKSVEFV